MENDVGASLERGSGARDPSLRGRRPQAAAEGNSRLLLRLRALSSRRSDRGGADRLPQSLKSSLRKNQKNLLDPKKVFSGNFFFSKTRNNYCAWWSAFIYSSSMIRSLDRS